jgi:hypothetical protein
VGIPQRSSHRRNDELQHRNQPLTEHRANAVPFLVYGYVPTNCLYFLEKTLVYMQKGWRATDKVELPAHRLRWESPRSGCPRSTCSVTDSNTTNSRALNVGQRRSQAFPLPGFGVGGKAVQRSKAERAILVKHKRVQPNAHHRLNCLRIRLCCGCWIRVTSRIGYRHTRAKVGGFLLPRSSPLSEVSLEYTSFTPLSYRQPLPVLRHAPWPLLTPLTERDRQHRFRGIGGENYENWPNCTKPHKV